MANTSVPIKLRNTIYGATNKMTAALGPVFDGGAYDLPEDQLALLMEVSFKIGMLREVLVNGDVLPDQVERLWQEEKARRAAAMQRFVHG
jgi:hypothetical protein